MALRGELAKQRRKKEAMRVRHEREYRQMIERQRRERAECDARLKELEVEGRRQGIVPPRPRSAKVQAGPRAIERVLAQFADGEPVTQKRIAPGAGLNSGTVSNALRALLEEGLIRETRRAVFEGSREFQVTAKGQRRLRQSQAA